MDDVDILIIGQGICGTFLGWYLQNAGLSYMIMDEFRPFSASRVAAGLINPITGRRLVKTWMIDELMPFALREYQMIAEELGINCLSEKSIVDFFPGPQMRNAFLRRHEEDPSYLHTPDDETIWNSLFQYYFGFGLVEPCWLVDLHRLLLSFRQNLIDKGKLIEQRFDLKEMVPGQSGIRYKTIRANKIIFCDGIESLTNPYFKDLPFAPNKGEALILEIPDLPAENIFKKGMSIVPWKDGLFWVGSSYEWDFADDQPTAAFRERATGVLREWLKIPFRIRDHFASIRPAAMERRPFIGFHPLQQNIGILNGMGTKACSLSPYFAKQLAAHLAAGSPLLPEADIRRFSKILSRSPSQ